MIRNLSTLFFRRNATDILMSVFGGLKISTIVGIAVLFITLDWFSGTINDIFSQPISSPGIPASHLWDGIKLFSFPGFLLICYYNARKANWSLKTHVEEFTEPRRVKALILFLSPPGKEDDSWIQELIKGGKQITNGNVLNSFKKSWRMPLEAIAYHLYRLEKVVVIPTTETQEHFETFKKLVHSLTPSDKTSNPSRLEVCSPVELDIPLDTPINSESFIQLNNILNAVFEKLTLQYRINDIMIDITSSKKIGSVAGAMVSLGKGKRFQYVSTDNYQVTEYDITLKTEDVK